MTVTIYREFDIKAGQFNLTPMSRKQLEEKVKVMGGSAYRIFRADGSPAEDIKDIEG